MSELFTAFLDTVAPENREFVSQIDEFLTAECKREVKTAKSGLADCRHKERSDQSLDTCHSEERSDEESSLEFTDGE